MTVSTADISVLNTLQRLYTLPTSRVKVPKNFGPNHTVLIGHNTTLPRCGSIGTQQGLYKDSLTHENPLRFQAKAVITLTNSQLLSKGRCPKRTELYPIDASPLALSVRLSQARVSN